MNLKINNSDNQNSIENLAFIRALLIKKSIENLEISYQEKEKIKENIIKYLNTH